MLPTKELIQKTKRQGESAVVKLLTEYDSDNSALNFILENLGILPRNFKGVFLFRYAQNQNPKLRLAAVKNIAKLNLNGTLNPLYEIFKTESKTEIRREIISAIGRQRNPQSKGFLIETLRDEDPKIICQAIRALLVFKADPEIKIQLKQLRQHKNEIVQSIIESEFYSAEQTKPKLPHPQTYNFLKNTVVHGDVQTILELIPEDSIHLTFTSPPYYNARDYSIYPSYEDYLKFLEAVFKAIHRVTKEGRFLLINTSPIIIPRVSRQHSSRRFPIPFDLHAYIVAAGWEFIDDIVWLKPETTVKNRIGGFQQHRKPLGYKPNAITEMVMVYRKKTNKLIDWNMRQYPPEVIKKSRVKDDFETTNVWQIDPTYSKNHSAVFPVELCRRVIQYYSFEGDLIFDPFGGSGTLGWAAKALNRLFFLTELKTEYFEYMKSTKKAKSIFGEPETKFLELTQFKNLIDDFNRPSNQKYYP